MTSELWLVVSEPPREDCTARIRNVSGATSSGAWRGGRSVIGTMSTPDEARVAPSVTETGMWSTVGAVGEPDTLTGPPLRHATGIGALTLGGVLADRAAHVPDRDAIVFDDPLLGDATVRWTYADLNHHARRVARALLARGVGKGSRVGLLMGN